MDMLGERENRISPLASQPSATYAVSNGLVLALPGVAYLVHSATQLVELRSSLAAKRPFRAAEAVPTSFSDDSAAGALHRAERRRAVRVIVRVRRKRGVAALSRCVVVARETTVGFVPHREARLQR